MCDMYINPLEDVGALLFESIHRFKTRTKHGD